MASEIDYARMAAYIDGEGCIGIHKRIRMRKGKGIVCWTLRVTVKQALHDIKKVGRGSYAFIEPSSVN